MRKLIDDIMVKIANEKNVPYTNEYGKLYEQDGLCFPSSQFVKFTESLNNKYYEEYENKITEIYINPS